MEHPGFPKCGCCVPRPQCPGGPLHCILSPWMCLLISLSEEINDSNPGNDLVSGLDPPLFPQPISLQPSPPALSVSLPYSLFSILMATAIQASSSPRWTLTLVSFPALNLRGLPAPGAALPLQWPCTLRTRSHPSAWCSRPFEVQPWSPFQPIASPCSSLTFCASIVPTCCTFPNRPGRSMPWAFVPAVPSA